MPLIGTEAIYHTARANIPAPRPTIYTCLLPDLAIERSNSVWATDITYPPMAHQVVCHADILNARSRAILAWRLSSAMTADCRVEALEEILAKFQTPEIFNTDLQIADCGRGWAATLKDFRIAKSIAGKGRWGDKVFIERLSCRGAEPFVAAPLEDYAELYRQFVTAKT